MQSAYTLPDEDTCWHAISHNDSAYDGRFVYAVSSTGIYCRPSCRSRLPQRENVRFYPLATTAEYAGYRPCKRCTPHTIYPQDEHAAAVLKLCRYIEAHHDQVLTLAQLSQIVHLSPHHLQRVFKRLMGITPRQYTDAVRIGDFKNRLRAGEDILGATFSAGFSASSRVYERADAHLGMTPRTYQRDGAGAGIHYQTVDTPLGLMLVAATERGICSISLGDDETVLIDELRAEFPAADIQCGEEQLAEWVGQILAYLEGWQPHLDLPLDLRVTAFQQRVLTELMRIPYGETRTYGDIAAAIGRPKSARAVGQACGSNPVPLVIPCHRVIGSDGRITGYRYGVARKERLLALEAAHQSAFQREDEREASAS